MRGATTRRRPDLMQLRRLWRRWVRVAAYYARGGGESPLSPEEYHKLHAALLAACQPQDAAEPLPAVKQLEDLARPWVSLDALAHTDKRLLLDLLDQCQRVQRLLDGRLAWRWPCGAAIATFAWGGMAGVVAVYGPKVSWDRPSLQSVFAGARGLAHRLAFEAQQIDLAEWFVVLTALMLVIGAWAVRSLGSY